MNVSQDRLDRNKWLAALKPGDVVALEAGGIGPQTYRLGTIKYITPKRTRIDVTWEGGQQQALDSDGALPRVKGSFRGRDMVVPVTEKILTANKIAGLQRRLYRVVMDERRHQPRSDLTISQMERIIAILEEAPNGEAPSAQLPRSGDLEQH